MASLLLLPGADLDPLDFNYLLPLSFVEGGSFVYERVEFGYNLSRMMMKTPPHLTRSEFNEILTRLTTGLSEILGEQLADVYLYGSYARGDAYDGSDIDILIVIDGEFDYFELMDKTSDLSWGLSLENDIVISRVFVSKTEFNDQNSPFLMNVHQEAIPV